MYTTDGAVIRADINTHVEEAQVVDKLFIASKVFPPYLSDVKDGTYPKFKIGESELLSPDVSKRAPTGSYNRVQRDFTMDTFGTEDRGLEELVDDAQKADTVRFFDQEVKSAKFVLRSMMLAHEVRVAAAVMNSGNFTATAALVAYSAANLANQTINPVGDILAAIQRLTDKGVVPNSIVLDSRMFTRVRQSTALQNYIRGNRPSDSQILLKPDDVAAAFELQNCFVGRMPKNVAKKGQAASLTPVWGTTYMWVGQIEGGDPQAGGAGRTIVWNKEGGLFVSETYRSEERRSNVVRVRQNTTEKVIDGSAGELITTSYS